MLTRNEVSARECSLCLSKTSREKSARVNTCRIGIYVFPPDDIVGFSDDIVGFSDDIVGFRPLLESVRLCAFCGFNVPAEARECSSGRRSVTAF